MDTQWLWDRKISETELKKIFGNSKHKRFVEMCALLLARNNDPQKVFGEFIDAKDFIRAWARIKHQMRKDSRNSQRIIFWQAVYETLIRKFQEKNITIRSKRRPRQRSKPAKVVANSIVNLRESLGASQTQIAKKLKISQQVLSNIEQGRCNLTIETLEKLARGFKKKLVIKFE